jgi:hypothetical protein
VIEFAADGADGDDDDVQPWDRMPDEPSKDYAAFRVFRDLPSLSRKLTTVAEDAGISERQARLLANRWEWRERADAWDDEVHHTEDRERLEAIRQMHSLHRQAGRAALAKALAGLRLLNPESMTAGTIARMLELGANLERSTLLVSVEEMQGIEVEDEDGEDPWDRIARELDPANYTDVLDGVSDVNVDG